MVSVQLFHEVSKASLMCKFVEPHWPICWRICLSAGMQASLLLLAATE